MIHPNVELGEGTLVEEGAIVGLPPRGREPGELPTKIGARGVIRSGTVVYAGTTIGDDFSAGHSAMIREGNLIGDRCSVGTHAVLEPGNTVGPGWCSQTTLIRCVPATSTACWERPSATTSASVATRPSSRA